MNRKFKASKFKKLVSRHSKKLRILGIIVLVGAFAATGTALINKGRAAPGACSTDNVIGSTSHTVSIPSAGQYRLWVRLQVPDTSNTGNLNGVHVQLNNNQCFAVTTTSSNAVNQWQWVNSSATASSTAHVTSQLNSGNNTVTIFGKKTDVRVDKLLLLNNSSSCTPSNDFSNGQPGENCTTPAPSITFTATPSTVTSGGSTTLNWSSTNAASCTASNGWTGSRQPNGSVSVGPLTQNTTYTLSCSGPGGSLSQNLAVIVTQPAPTLTLSANPATITSGSTSSLTWSSTNAASCTASNGWTGSKSANGSETTPALTSTRTYTLTCANSSGVTVSRDAIVTVQAASDPPVVSLQLENVTVPNNASSITVNNLRSLVWVPQVSAVSGIQSVTYRVNSSNVSLTNGKYTIGAANNGNFSLQVTAVGNNGQSTTRNLTVRVRHPDFNRSSKVDIFDLNPLISNWGQNSNVYDLNANGSVDIFDLSLLINYWGE